MGTIGSTFFVVGARAVIRQVVARAVGLDAYVEGTADAVVAIDGRASGAAVDRIAGVARAGIAIVTIRGCVDASNGRIARVRGAAVAVVADQREMPTDAAGA